jgi:CRP-like cAMP-binding protein
MPFRVASPTHSRRFEPKNRLLSALPGKDLLNLRPFLEAVPLAPGGVLFDANESLTRLYLIETGVAALLTTFENGAIGVAAVGREGAVDVQSFLLGGGTAVGRCRVLVPGSALGVEIWAFRSALRKSPKLRAACEACTRALFIQVLQAVPCNKLHSLEQRCARWLLMCADLTAEDTFELTRGGLADMLGVPESTLTVVVRKLENGGMICRCRSALTVVDRPGLEMAACECYRIVRNRCRRLRSFD